MKHSSNYFRSRRFHARVANPLGFMCLAMVIVAGMIPVAVLFGGIIGALLVGAVLIAIGALVGVVVWLAAKHPKALMGMADGACVSSEVTK